MELSGIDSMRLHSTGIFSLSIDDLLVSLIRFSLGGEVSLLPLSSAGVQEYDASGCRGVGKAGVKEQELDTEEDPCPRAPKNNVS